MDIKNREDIERLVNTFYSKVKKDDVIGYIFNDVVRLDWDAHLPVMYNFWETLILNTGDYTGNTMGVHFNVNKMVALEEHHFTRWLTLFEETIHELFEGPVADNTLKRARSIASLMQFKMKQQSGLS